MEYHIRIPGPLAVFDAIDNAIRDADPSALVDVAADATTLRIATLLPRLQVAGLVSSAGHPVTPDQVRQLPSICCGGCSG